MRGFKIIVSDLGLWTKDVFKKQEIIKGKQNRDAH